MQCDVCDSRPAGGYCGECRAKVCTHCGRKCAACSKILCPKHMQRTDGGRVLCAGCMAERNAQRAQKIAQQKTQVQGAPAAPPAPPQAAKPPQEAARGGFSFQELQAELGDGPAFSGGGPGGAPSGKTHTEGLVNPDTGLEETYDPEVDAKLAELLGEDGNVRMEALGGSASRATPTWVSGLFGAGVSLVLCLLLWGGSGFNAMQPYTSYSILLLAFGTIVWSVFGVFQSNDTPTNRKLCALPIVIALIAAVIAVVRMNPPRSDMPF